MGLTQLPVVVWKNGEYVADGTADVPVLSR